MGESIAEGTVVRWIKKVGDQVDRDEPLFEISTDKVDAEIPSPADGVLMAIAGRVLPAAHTATGMAVLTTFTSLARFLSSVAFGWVWTARDPAAAVRFFAVGLVVSIILAAIALSRAQFAPASINEGSSNHGGH